MCQEDPIRLFDFGMVSIRSDTLLTLVLTHNRGLENLKNGGQISQIGTLSEHSRPVECLCNDANNSSSNSTVLFSADSMGIIKVWQLEKNMNGETRCRAELKFQLGGHETGINDMWFGYNQLWTGRCEITLCLILSLIYS